jgi:hypothetical protein
MAVIRPYVIGCMLTYNSAATVLAALISVENVIDYLIVIDGDFDGNASDDDTARLIDGFADYASVGPRISVTKAAVGGPLWVKRQAYMDRAQRHIEAMRPNAAVWILQVDSDEVYDDRVNRLPRLLSGLPQNIVTVGWRMHLFTRDLQYEERIALDAQVRAHRLLPGMRYRHMRGGLEELVDANGEPTIAEGRTHWPQELAVFHYHRHLSLEQKAQKVRQYLRWQGLDESEVQQQVSEHTMHYDHQRWLQECVLPRRWRPEEHPWALREAALCRTMLAGALPGRKE